MDWVWFGQTVRHWLDPERRPCVLHGNGRYYLFWKGGNGTRYAISDNPLDFRDREAYFFGTCHASEIVEWDGL